VLFLILPALESTRSSGGNFCELEHCLEALCLTPAASEALTALITPEQMQCICDTKHVGGQQYYRLSDDRLLAWLSVKVEQTKAALVDQAAGFAGMDAMGLTVYAAGILGEYLSPEWSTKLSKYLGLPQPGDGAGGSNATGAAAPPPLYNPDVAFDRATESKRPRFDPKEAAKAKAQAARAEAKAAKIAKEAAGMRKLSSFFSKKS
jgi:ribonuclease H2 subunit B